jgi:flagellar biosynthetic protein FlhB
MAEDSDLERTEPASSKRLQEAREKGNVPRSRELATFAVLAAGAGGMLVLSSQLASSLSHTMRDNLSLDRAAAFEPSRMSAQLFDTTLRTLVEFSPLLLLLAAVAIGANMMISGWLFSSQALQADFARMNPLAGIKRMFSATSVVELVKAVLKSALIGGVAYLVIANEWDEILGLLAEPGEAGMAHAGRIVAMTLLTVAASLALIALVDVPFQLWHHAKSLRMSKEEVRQENKETEGDPQIKARIRALQREAARRRMMSEVPKADVVVTNPRHYAVALRYEEGNMRAPRVVAKGAELIAARIRELAEQHGVPMVEAPPLARALFRHAELGQEVPMRLYTAVAEVLAYVYQLKAYRSGPVPRLSETLAVPPELDPGVVA